MLFGHSQLSTAGEDERRDIMSTSSTTLRPLHAKATRVIRADQSLLYLYISINTYPRICHKSYLFQCQKVKRFLLGQERQPMIYSWIAFDELQ